jgi:hypothetical protein
VDLIARVEGAHGVHFVRVAPIGTRFECNVRPRLPIGALITIGFAGLHGVSAEALEAWRRAHAPTEELDRRRYRPTVLADLMTATNAELFLGIAREASADRLAGFARERGGALLAEIRGALDQPDRIDQLVARSARFAEILGIRDLPLSELAGLHPVEHLMALEHAVVTWMRATAAPPSDELAALARSLPDDAGSAAVSLPWLQWWWQLAHSCTRADLHAIVRAALELARTECRYGTAQEVARVALDEASRLAELARIAPRAAMWATSPSPIALAELVRDETDAHYASYMALTHCAHAIAAALRDDMDPPAANRHAAELLARRALELLR